MKEDCPMEREVVAILVDGQRESIVRHRETDEELARAIIRRRGLK